MEYYLLFLDNNSELNSMNRAFLVILLMLPGLLSYSQVISGVVLDEGTREPIGYAALFFNGTFVGTTSDESGFFELDVSRYSSRSLIVSAMGYESGLIAKFAHEEPLQVLLTRKFFIIDEVSVSAESLTGKRKECLRIFRNEFIGRSGNAQKCSILNEMDITFNYSSDEDTLKAYASKPIQIQNLALGYDITYYLERFEYNRNSKSLLFIGSIVFNRDLASEPGRQKRYERRRKYTFTGSSYHFFRSLWSNSLKTTGFSLSNERTGTVLDCEQIVFEDQMGRKFIKYPENLEIQYYNDYSFISLLKERVYFEQDGFFDPTSIRWNGKMSEQRIADFLPYEYALPGSN